MILSTNQTTQNTPFSISATWNQDSIIEISESALNNNISLYKKHIGPHNTLAVVIKGNGYGHGLTTMGLLCQKNDLVDWICVANYSEACILRHIAITKPILILGYAKISSFEPIPHNTRFMVDSLEYAQYLNSIGQKNRQKLNIHLKIDTGLSRFGINPHNIHTFIQQLQALPYIHIEGIFSHFIASDNNADLTQKQLCLFLESINSATSVLKHALYIHMSNTASTTGLEYSSLCNFFRVGLGIYGFSNHNLPLQPVLTWKTHIIATKTIAAHSYVSYACSYKTTRTTRIALLPVGYSDGYQLRFSNKTSVLINNHLAPVIGRIGMNITIVDTTDCQASIGDEVVLIGNRPEIHVTDLAKAADIYNVREIFTGIQPSIQRVITK